MAQFRVTGPDGNTYDVSAPDGATEADVLAKVKEQAAAQPGPAIGPLNAATPPQGRTQAPMNAQFEAALPSFLPEGVRSAMGTVDAAFRLGMRGVTAGLSDYVEAGATRTADRILGMMGVKPANATADFDDALSQVRGGVREFQRENPVIGYGAEVAGAIASPLYKAVGVGASKLVPGIAGKAVTLPSGQVINSVGNASRFGGYAAQGAATGGLAGAGYAQSNTGGVPAVDELAFSTGVGAAIGAPLGLIGGAAVEGAGPLFNWFRGKMASRAPMPPPSSTPPGGAVPAAGTQAPGVPPSGPPSNPRDMAVRLLARAADDDSLTSARMRARLNQLGPEGMIGDLGPNIGQYTTEAATRPGPGMNTVAVNLGARDRQAEGRLVNAISGGGREGYGELLTTRAAQRSQSARPLYEEAFTEITGPATTRSRQITSPTIERLLADPDFNKGIQTGIRLLEKEASVTGEQVRLADYALRRNPESGQFERVGTPTLRLLDSAKKGVDELLYGGGTEFRDPITGSYTQMGRALLRQNNALKSEADRLTTIKTQVRNPETGAIETISRSPYAEARASWAGPTAEMRAAQDGTKWLTMDTQDLQLVLKGMGPAEREAYLTGVANNIQEAFEKNPQAARKALQRTFAQKRLAMIFPDSAERNSFRKVLEQEEIFRASTTAKLGGSQTKTRQAVSRDIEGQMSAMGDAATTLAITRSPTAATTDLMQRAISSFNRTPQQVLNELAKLTTSRDPEVKAWAIQAIESARRQMALEQAQIRSMAARGAGNTSAALSPVQGSP